MIIVALGASGCGSDGSGDESRQLPRALGDDLVRRAENVRATLEDGDGCAALVQAEQLRRVAEQAIEQNRVPPELQGELRQRANDLASSVVCAQPPAPPPPIPEGGDGEEEEDD